MIVVIDGVEKVSFQVEDIAHGGKRIGNQDWKILTDDNILDEKYRDANSTEPESYQVKIAIKEDLSDKLNRLFTYLPTEVEVKLPLVIHATLDLNNSRNHLLASSKNQFVLGKVVDQIVRAIKENFQETVDWRPFQLLSYSHQNEDLKKNGFYGMIDRKREELAIYPCLDESYRSKNHVVYYSEAFSEFILRIGSGDLFPNMLKPLGPQKSILSGISQPPMAGFVNAVTKLSRRITDFKERVQLIMIIAEQQPTYPEGPKFPLLTATNGKVISTEKTVFTPRTKGEKVPKLPPFVKVDFIELALFDLLIETKGIEKSGEKSRDIQRALKHIVKIQSFEPAPLLEKIVTETKRAIKNKPDKRKEYHQLMLKSIFDFRKMDRSDKPMPTLQVTVELPTRAGKYVDSRRLFLGQQYPSGELTEELFGEIFDRSEFAASPKRLGLEGEDAQDVENFLIWLGVNKHTRFTAVTNPRGYEEFVFKHVRKPEGFRSSKVNTLSIENLEDLANRLGKEKVIIWIIRDEEIRNRLATHSNEFQYDKSGERWDSYYYRLNAPSYLKYRFQSLRLFANFLIDDHKISFLNPFPFDYGHPLFLQYNISRNEINLALQWLGALDSFAQLPLNRVYEIVNSLEKEDPEGNFTQRIYRLAVKYFGKDNDSQSDVRLRLYAHKGLDGGWFDNSEVFYSENAVPKKISEKNAILNFPKRSGERQVRNLFGVKSFKGLGITILSGQAHEMNRTRLLMEHLQKIKPFLLVHRLNRLDSDKIGNREEEAKKINALEILVYSTCSYRCDGKDDILEENDFVNVGNLFHVRTKPFEKVNELFRDSGFCDAFAEMISITFSVVGQGDGFRSTFKNDVEDTEHSIVKDFGKEILLEARTLLGLTKEAKEFWELIFQIVGLPEIVCRDLDHIQLVLSGSYGTAATFVKRIDYDRLAAKENFLLLRQLFDALSIDIVNQPKLQELIDFREYHKEGLKLVQTENEKGVGCLIWKDFASKKSSQKQFLAKLLEYNSKFEDYSSKALGYYKWKIECPYAGIVNQFTLETFGIEVKPVKCVHGYAETFKSNLEKTGLIDAELKLEDRSLLCFDGNNDIVKLKYPKAAENESTSNGGNDTTPVVPTVSFLTITANGVPPTPATSGGGGFGGTYHPNTDRRRRKAGKDAEILVYDYLVREYGKENVSWVSGNSGSPTANDAAGYDIHYVGTDKRVKYLEVKASAGDGFYLSENERLFGLSHKEDYELAIVNGTHIQFVTEFFVFPKAEDFENNFKFRVERKEYFVRFRLIEMENQQ